MHRTIGLGLACALTAGTVFADEARTADPPGPQVSPHFMLYESGSRITTVYGSAFSFGVSPEDSADAFLASYSEMLGAPYDDLVPISRLSDARPTIGLMYRPETGDYKFTLVYYSQYRDGLPVFRGEARLLVRNESGHPLVLVRNALRDLGDFTLGVALPDVRDDLVEKAALAVFPGMVDMTVPELVIWAGYEDLEAEPRVAVTFIAENGLSRTPDHEKWLFVCDAATGVVLYKENQVHNDQITGTVKGRGMTDHRVFRPPPDCSTSTYETYNLPYARLNIGQTAYYADEDGDFVIPDPGEQVTVYSRIYGKYFYVLNDAGSEALLSATANPPNTLTFTHNATGSAEYTTAEVNAYVEANIARATVLAACQDFPTIGGDDPEEDFEINVNIDATCNAFYNGTINFYREQGGCANSAFGEIIHHEYGHHVVEMGGSGQGQYGEGMSDALGVLITDRPENALGWDLSKGCEVGERNADNTKQYPCTGEIHDCGQLLSGCVWDTRNELIESGYTKPEYLEILQGLAINAVPLHTGLSIATDITLDFWTLDDDNDDISDGTPNYNDIYCGFAAHRMIPDDFRKGDMNCDGAVNGSDTDPFWVAIGSKSNYESQYPDCNYINADINGDGAVNGSDIDAYFTCLGAGGNCCPCERSCYFLP